MADVPLTLYHIAPSRSSIVHWLLEELGEPYELHLLDGRAEENRKPAYLAVNPMGKVPALKHGEVVVTEAAAICCYLADTFPRAGLAAAIGDPARGPYLKWLFFGPGCLEPAIVDRMLERAPGPRSAVGYGDFDTVMDVLCRALAPGPYLLGERFTAADVVIGAGLRWGMMMQQVPRRPEIAAYVERLEARPALQRSFETDRRLAGQGEPGVNAPEA